MDGVSEVFHKTPQEVILHICNVIFLRSVNNVSRRSTEKAQRGMERN